MKTQGNALIDRFGKGNPNMNEDDDITLHLSPRVASILALFARHGHDMDKLIAAHPEITPSDVAEVTMELAGTMFFGAEKPRGTKRRKAKKDDSSGQYQIKITLRGSKPPIWRRVVIPGESTLGRLHDVIQRSMGWDDGHLHMFEIDGERFTCSGQYGFDPESGELDESDYRLCDVLNREKVKFRYDYDFGDSWQHVLRVEKIIPAPPAQKDLAP
jgi:hypothetical protein